MNHLKKIYYLLVLVVWYTSQLVKANLIIAWDILTPRLRTNPAFLEVPLTIQSDMGLLLFSNLLSMTPGTMTLDISENKKILWAHVLYFSSEEKMLREFERFQKKIKRITG